jgi:hypothetical protein
MLNLDLGRARSDELRRQARWARLGKHAHTAAPPGRRRGLLELRVGLGCLLVRWGLTLLRPQPAEELDGRDAEHLLNDVA